MKIIVNNQDISAKDITSEYKIERTYYNFEDVKSEFVVGRSTKKIENIKPYNEEQQL